MEIQQNQIGGNEKSVFNRYIKITIYAVTLFALVLMYIFYNIFFGVQGKRIDNGYYSIGRWGTVSVLDQCAGGDWLESGNCNHYYPKKIDGVDVKSFHIFDVDDLFAKDKNYVYWDGVKVQGVDPSTFEILSTYHNYGYAKDKNGVYYYEDSNKVGRVNGRFSISDTIKEFLTKNNGLKKISDDPNNFVVFEYKCELEYVGDPCGSKDIYFSIGYAKDSLHVFHLDSIVNDADVKSFRFENKCHFFFDANNKYDGVSETIHTVRPSFDNAALYDSSYIKTIINSCH